MKAENFCRWLQGYFALSRDETIDEPTTRLIREHLALAFKYDIDRRYPKEHWERLNEIHNGTLIASETEFDPADADTDSDDEEDEGPPAVQETRPRSRNNYHNHRLHMKC